MNEARRHGYQGRTGLAVKARRQALSDLLARHEVEYRRLVDERRAAMGLPPAKRGRPAA